MKKTITLLFGGLLILPALLAVRTQFFSDDSYAGFNKGEFSNVSLSDQGLLQLAPALTEVADLDEPVVLSTVVGPQGAIYLGTGNYGKVVKVSPSGEMETIFQPEEILIRALAVDEQGALYVGTSPVGRVYRIVDGKHPEIFFDPEETYIWDLLFDREGNLFVATGDPGRIYKLAADFASGDEPLLWFSTDQTHLTVLAWDANGYLLAGSSPGGILYRITGAEEGFALYDSEAREIKHIEALEDGSVIFSTFDINKTASTLTVQQPIKDQDENEFTVTATTQGTGKPAEPAARLNSGPLGSSILYKLDKEGFVWALWRTPRSNIYSFQRLGQGEWLVGTNDDGKLYTVSENREWSLLQQLPLGGEISGLLPDPAQAGAVLVITGNPAKIYRLEKENSAEGSFTSDTLDARQVARWGKLLPVSGGSAPPLASFRTRSGNTSKHDNTWSDWQEVENDDGVWTIRSPNARYLQYEATFSAESETLPQSAGLRQVRVFYQTKNAAPTITSIRLIPKGFQLLKTVSNPTPIDLSKLLDGKSIGNNQDRPEARRQLRPLGEDGLLTVAWKAYDPNGDRLEYTVSLKGDSDDEWITLADKLEDPVTTIDTKGLTEGYYRFGVSASDSPDNQEDHALSTFRLSEIFLVDNTSPVLSIDDQDVSGGHASMVFTARDSHSVLQSAGYTLDGRPLRSALPDDGLFDSKEETFTLEFSELSEGAHSLIFKVQDEKGKSAVITVPFTVD